MQLQTVIDQAIQQNMCTRWGCTTCGTRNFEELVARHLDATLPLSVHALRRLAQELRELQTTEAFEPLEFLILWMAIGLSPRELTFILSDSPVGGLYKRMREAKAKRDEARQEHEKRNDPKIVEERRAAKKAAKAAAHAERLRRKALRDVEWRRTREES